MNDKPTLLFSIIIISHNEGNWLQKTIDSILSDNSSPPFEIIVVNDSSTDNSFNFFTSAPYANFVKQKKIQVITGNKLGPSRARNLGAKYAKGTVFIFLDAHMETISGWLEEVKNTIQHIPDISALTILMKSIGDPKTKQAHSPLYIPRNIMLSVNSWVLVENPENNTIRVPFIPSGCLVIKKECFENVGGFPDFLKSWGCEDLAFSILLYMFGYHCYLDPNIQINHRFVPIKKQTPSMIEAKKHLLFNSLACGYVLYDDLMFTDLIEGLTEKYGPLECNDDYRQYLAEKQNLDNYKKKLSDKRKKSYSDFAKEFSEYLPYLQVLSFRKALNVKKNDKEKAFELLNKAELIKYSYHTFDYTLVRALCNVQKAYIALKSNPPHALSYAMQAFDQAPLSVPVLLCVADVFFAQKKFVHALPYLLSVEKIILGKKIKKSELDQTDYLKAPGKIYDMLSIALYYAKQYPEAVKYVKRAIENHTDLARLQKNHALFAKYAENDEKKKDVSK